MEDFGGPPPSMPDGYDNTNDNVNVEDHGKFQDCEPSLEEHPLDNSQLPLHNDDANTHVEDQQAVHAAMDAASTEPAESLPTFAELDGPLPESQDNANLNPAEDAFLEGHDHDEPYAHPYTRASVPVPPMMDWDHAAQHDNGRVHVQVQVQTQATPNPIANTMDLHSPIVSASAEPLHAHTEAAADAAAAPLPPTNHNHHRNNAPPNSEPIYTSYAIAPGPPPPPPHHHHPHHPHAMPPHPSPAPHPHYDPHAPPHAIYAHYPPHAYAMPPPQAPPQAQMIPPYPAVAAIPNKPNPPPHSNHNSNFWLQEEEERFLLGLRLYGWGQWKRIQTVVQTRSNKQIKSHAQKREKVNPEIKFKYAKGKSRRGRISSKVLATEYAAGMPEQDAVAAASSLNDPRLPPMEELWKDVYGTNNGVGPNSRLRRYRSNALHQKWLEEVADKSQAEQVPQPMATEKKLKSPMSSEPVKQDKETASTSTSKKKLTPEGQYIHEHKVLERHAMAPPQQQQPSTGQPMSYYNAPHPPPPHGHPYPTHHNYAMPPPPGVSPTRMHPPGPAYPPPGYPPVAMAHHPSMQPPHPGAHPPPIIHHGNAPVATAPHANAQGNVVVVSNEEPLRPGMRVYARNKNSPLWFPGVIYSAKVDPNMSIDPNQAAVPLLYHVQYDGGEEDPEVQEEYIVGKTKYDKALDDLEAYYDLSMGRSIRPAPLEGGLPVYAQWMERSNPTSHARWLPGTIDSVRTEDTPHGPIHTYHILFDNSAEKSDVPSECVMDRNEYHELVKHKHHNPYPHADSPSSTPIGEIYNLFSRGDANAAGSGQGMDLLFTASQMAAPMDTLKKRDASAMTKEEEGGGDGANNGDDPSSKRIKTEHEEQQQQQQLMTQHEEIFTL